MMKQYLILLFILYSTFLQAQTYCMPGTIDGGYGIGIKKVQIGTETQKIDKPSNDIDHDGVCTGGISHDVRNYTASDNALLFFGGTYKITTDLGQAAACNDSIQLVVWMDFNQNGLFEEQERMVYDSNVPRGISSEHLIKIPITASPGQTRMRVYVDNLFYDATGNHIPPDPGRMPDACHNYMGEMEDYSITLTNGAMRYGSAIATQNDLSNVHTETTAVIIGAKITMDGGIFSPKTLKNLSFSPTGTTNVGGEVLYYQLFYTGNSPVFSNSISWQALIGTGPIFFPNVQLASGDNYFWLCYYLRNAVGGHFVDAVFDSLNIDNIKLIPSIIDPDPQARMISNVSFVNMTYQSSAISQAKIGRAHV